MEDKEKLIVAHMFKQNSYMEQIDVSENKFLNGSISNVAYSRMPFEEGEEISFFFTTGLLSNTVYVAASDGDTQEITNLLSNLEFGDKYGIESKLGSVVQLQDNKYFEKNGCFGAVMLSVNTLFFLESFENKISYTKDEIEFLLVVFLSRDEYSLVKSSGVKEFLENLGDKDLFSISN